MGITVDFPDCARRLCRALLSGLHFLCRIEHGANNLVVARAATQVARQPVAHLVFAGIWVVIEQSLGRNEEAGRANAALQRCVLEEFLLYRMQSLGRGKSFNRGDLFAIGLC